MEEKDETGYESYKDVCCYLNDAGYLHVATSGIAGRPGKKDIWFRRQHIDGESSKVEIVRNDAGLYMVVDIE